MFNLKFLITLQPRNPAIQYTTHPFSYSYMAGFCQDQLIASKTFLFFLSSLHYEANFPDFSLFLWYLIRVVQVLMMKCQIRKL